MHAPEEYEEHKSYVRRDIDQSVSALLQQVNMKPGELILDYGCGAGTTCSKHFLPLAHKYDSHIHAVDVSQEMVQYAINNHPHPRLTYTIGNILAQDFPLANEKFDKVFSIYVFHYIKDYRGAIQRFFEILKPGGQFAFTVVLRSFLFSTYQIIGEDPRFKPYMKGYEEFVPEWYEEKQCAEHGAKCFRNAAQAAGFTIKHMEIHRRAYKVNIEVQLGLYLALNPYVKVIPEELHGEMRDAYRKAMCENFNLVNEGLKEYEPKYEMLTAVLEKPI